jgi:predicted TIM-barrel fold metal-dependent hydrolase
MIGLQTFVADLRLVDHHCHGLVSTELDRTAFEEMLTEADTVSPLGTTLFDSLIGLAVRRWCAPVLDLEPHTPADDYLARRAELGAEEVNRRFLRATGTGDFLLDGGFQPDKVTSTAELARLAQARAHDIVRLERVAEDVVCAGTTGVGFADAFLSELANRTVDAVGVKSVAAYRVGLELSGGRPTAAEVAIAAGNWLADVEVGAPIRLADEVLHRFLIWSGIDLGLPVQLHVGYGDSDVDLHRCNPLLLTELLRATQPSRVPILLLHNYPYHREAAYLAQVFEHVFVDVGLSTHNTGYRASAVIAETLEIVPFGKFLFSTDAFGLGELYHLGTLLFRRGLSDFLTAGLDAGECSVADAERISRLVGVENAQRVYALEVS